MKRKAGDFDRWLAEIAGGKLGKQLKEAARQKDRKQDHRKGVQARRLIEKTKPK